MPEHLSRREVFAAIGLLSDEDKTRLILCARKYGARYLCEAEELLDETLYSLMELKRKCPRSVPFISAVCGAMRGNASNHYYASRLRKGSGIPRRRDGDDGIDGIPDDRPGEERKYIGAQEVALVKATILSLFPANSIEHRVVVAIFDDLERAELRALTGLNEKEFAALMKRIDRLIERAFPNGWKP